MKGPFEQRAPSLFPWLQKRVHLCCLPQQTLKQRPWQEQSVLACSSCALGFTHIGAFVFWKFHFTWYFLSVPRLLATFVSLIWAIVLLFTTKHLIICSVPLVPQCRSRSMQMQAFLREVCELGAARSHSLAAAGLRREPNQYYWGWREFTENFEISFK